MRVAKPLFQFELVAKTLHRSTRGQQKNLFPLGHRAYFLHSQIGCATNSLLSLDDSDRGHHPACFALAPVAEEEIGARRGA